MSAQTAKITYFCSTDIPLKQGLEYFVEPVGTRNP